MGSRASARAVCICGGGSLSHALVAAIGSLPEFTVRVLTRQPCRWKKVVRGIYLDRAELVGEIALASDDPGIVTGAEIVLVAVPQVAVDELLRQLRPHLSPGAWLGAIPGYGGIDWRVRHILGQKQRFFGLQRVPYVRTTISYGEAVWISGIRPHLYVGTLPIQEAERARRLVEELLGIPTTALPSYLPINLTTTNPTFHPARIYSAFGESLELPGDIPPPQFYADWDDAASFVFLKLDEELRRIADKLPGRIPHLMDIRTHYGVTNVKALTSCIRGIEALRDRPLPLRSESGQWRFDGASPYVTEDIRYGLAPIKGVADVVGVEAPMIDRILHWADEFLDPSLYDSTGKLRVDGTFPHPRHYGLCQPSALVAAAL